jgi:hypothetical protein
VNDGTLTGVFNVAVTGGEWKTVDVTETVSLRKGKNTLRLLFDKGGFTLRSMSFTK